MGRKSREEAQGGQNVGTSQEQEGLQRTAGEGAAGQAAEDNPGKTTEAPVGQGRGDERRLKDAISSTRRRRDRDKEPSGLTHAPKKQVTRLEQQRQRNRKKREKRKEKLLNLIAKSGAECDEPGGNSLGDKVASNGSGCLRYHTVSETNDVPPSPSSKDKAPAKPTLPTSVTPNNRSKNAKGGEHAWTQSKNNVQDASRPQGHLEPDGRSALSIDTTDADEKKSISNANCALPNVVTPTSTAEVKPAEEQEYARTHSNIYVQDTATSPGNLDDSEYEPNERNALSIEISVPHDAPHNITISIETTVRSDPTPSGRLGV